MPATMMRSLRGLPLYFDPKPECPAAEALGESPTGSGVVCNVTHSTVTSGSDPTSLMGFCLSPQQGYQNCPAWRAARDAEREDRLRYLRKDFAE